MSNIIRETDLFDVVHSELQKLKNYPADEFHAFLYKGENFHSTKYIHVS